jgi:hypothetical protein
MSSSARCAVVCEGQQVSAESSAKCRMWCGTLKQAYVYVKLSSGEPPCVRKKPQWSEPNWANALCELNWYEWTRSVVSPLSIGARIAWSGRSCPPEACTRRYWDQTIRAGSNQERVGSPHWKSTATIGAAGAAARAWLEWVAAAVSCKTRTGSLRWGDCVKD